MKTKLIVLVSLLVVVFAIAVWLGRGNNEKPQEAMAQTAVTFTDMTDSSGVGAASQLMIWPFPAGLGDLDNDGDLDLYFVDHGDQTSSSRLLRNDGNFVFTDITQTAGISGTLAQGNSNYIFDLNADGFSEIIIGADRDSGPDIWQNNQNFTFTNKGTLVNRTPTSIGFSDFDGDGDLDLYAGKTQTDGAAYVCDNQASYKYSVSNILPVLPNIFGVNFLDINGDNLDDALISKYNYGIPPDINIFLKQGNGIFSQTSKDQLGFASDVYNGNFADIDNDGDLDMLSLGTAVKLYENDGTGHFADITSGSGLPTSLDASIIFFDFDNDGYLDFITGGYWKPNYLYRNRGNKTFEKITTSGLPTNKGAFINVGDMDNDGDMDVVLSGPSNGSKWNGVYRNNLNNSNWLKINLKGVSPNTAAIGAKVWVYETGHLGDKNYLKGYRQLTDKNLHLIHFGCDVAKRYDVRARFSNGNIVDKINIATGQILTIQDSGGTPSLTCAQAGGTCKANSCNSYQGCSSLSASCASGFCCSGSCLDAPTSGFSFTNVTNSAGISNMAGLNVWMSGYGDIDGDGFSDMVLGSTGSGGVKWFKNSGSFSFGSANSVTAELSQSISLIDINNDGFLDVFSGANQWGYVEPHINNGNNQFTKQNLFPDNLTSVTLALGDFENDGDLDVGVANDAQNAGSRWFKNNGNFTYTEVSDPPYRQGIGALIMADFNGDHLTDIYAGHWWFEEPGGVGYILLNQGNGHFVETQRIGDLVLEDGIGYAGVADFDNDGDLDIMSAHPYPKLYVNDGNGQFTQKLNAGLPNTIPLSGESPYFGDINNDGLTDVRMPGSGKIYKNLGNNTFQEITTALNITPSQFLLFDVDNDGDLDLVSNSAAYRNELNNQNWLKVKVNGISPNIQAIGAKIWVYEAGHLGDRNYLKGYREILAGSSAPFLPVQHFGLSSSLRYDVRVRFPNSSVADRTNVATGQTLSVSTQGAPACQSTKKVIATLNPQTSVVLNSPTTVSFGLPLAKGELTDVSLIRVKNSSNTEIPAYVRSLLPWRNLANSSNLSSVRSALVQFSYTFTNYNPVNITVEIDCPRTLNVSSEIPVKNSWALVNDSKYPSQYNVKEPSVYVTLSADWLGKSVLKTETKPYNTYSSFSWYDNALNNENPSINEGQNFFKTMINDDSRVTQANDIDYLNPGEYETWLFDRAMTMYQVYIRSGKLSVLKEAHRAAYFYGLHLNSNGYFDLKTDYPDSKYSYGESLLTDLMLTGDEGYLPQLNNITKAADAFNYVHNPNTSVLWTERHLSFAWLAYITAFEATGNGTYAQKARNIADYIFQLQDNPPSNTAGGQAPNTGALMHTYLSHEGYWDVSKPYWTFSPWMSVFLVDAMQRYYYHSNDQRILLSLQKFGNAVSDVALVQYDYSGQTKTIPAYLASPQMNEIEYDDKEHALDVAKITSLAYWAAKQTSGNSQKYLNATDQLLSTAQWNQDGWIRPGASLSGLSIYRLAPPRKFNWWFRTTSDLDYLLGGAITPPVGQPAISLTKSSNKTQASLGEEITYIITYNNIGTGNATEVTITDPIPTGTTYVPGSASNGGSLTNNTLTWAIGVVATGGSGSVSFRVKVDGGTVTPSSPLALDLKFDENSGQTLFDSSGNSNNGTLGASVSSATDDPQWQTGSICRSGSCLQFDGVNDYADCGTNSSLTITGSNITIAAWVYWKNASSYDTIIDKDRNYTIRINAATPYYPQFYNYNGGHIFYSDTIGGAIPLNTWTQIAIVLNGSTYTWYRNGVKTTTGVQTAGLLSDTDTLKIGASAALTATTFWNGNVDNVKIYNTVLTAEQVSQLYTSGQ